MSGSDDGIDPAVAASYARAMARRGQPISLQRINGAAPRTALVSAEVPALVSGMRPDGRDAARSGHGASLPGAVTEDSRTVVVLVADLERQRYPLPVRQDDRIVLASGDTLNVLDVDPNTRRLAGAIEMTASGVG